MSGKDYAERILSIRQDASDQQQGQIRKGEILKSGIPDFFSQLSDYLKKQTRDFNFTLDVSDDHGLHFYGCDAYLTLTKKSSPVFILKAAIMHERLKITTQVFAPRVSSEPTERYHVFSVSKLDSETTDLDGKGFYQFGEDLFSEAVAHFPSLSRRNHPTT